jgi:EmrB/QacA subfamily drug resistance transporter
VSTETPAATTTSAPPGTTSGHPGQTSRRVAHPTLILLLIAGAQLMVVLDGTIVNIALPSMARYFNKNQTDMTWAINAYTLAFGGLLLLGGRAGDILGRRQMFIVGLGLFTLGSFLGGIAPTFQLLLGGRVIQGIGGAIASPTALSLVTTSFPQGKERNRAFAVYAAVSGAGAALGLLLGGILTEYLDWRWVLFVNVPIGLALIVGAFFYLPNSERLSGKFDLVGAVLSVAGMVSLVYGFIHAANAKYGWQNGVTIGALAAGVILLIAFGVFESRYEHAMMPMRIFNNRARSGAYVVMLVVGAGMFGMFYFLTFFVQGVMGYSSLKAGVAFVPVSVVIIIGSGIMSQIMPRTGPKVLISIGAGLMTVALFYFATVNASSGYLNKILPGMLILALGMSFIFVPLTTVAVHKVRNTDSGLASALLNVGQQVGGAIGLSVLATVAATAATNSGKSHAKSLAATHPGSLQHYAQLAASYSTGKVASASALRDSIALRAYNEVQAHSAAMGFLAAGIFGTVGLLVSIVMINVKKEEVATEVPEGVAVG